MISNGYLIGTYGPNSGPLRNISLQSPVTLTLTFQGDAKSNVMVPLDSPFMVSY